MKKKDQIPLSLLRTSRGLSQKDLATELGFSAGLIGHYEAGIRKPSLEKAILIASYFNTPLESISFANHDKTN